MQPSGTNRPNHKGPLAWQPAKLVEGTHTVDGIRSDASRDQFARQLLAAPATIPDNLHTAPSPTPAGFQVDAGDPNLVLTFQIANMDAFNGSGCVNACTHGVTCGWQIAWVWFCNHTNVVDNFWVWEPSGLIRSASNDSFAKYPELCLDMCKDFALGNGACALSETSGLLNVGWRECTGHANQVIHHHWCLASYAL